MRFLPLKNVTGVDLSYTPSIAPWRGGVPFISSER